MESYRIENLTFTYPERESPALSEINTTIKRGGFTVVCGSSGCGKTTLLRRLKPSAAPEGRVSGMIFFDGAPLDALGFREQSAGIGFVTQNPENQTVTDKVWHELAFGLESLGLKTQEIRLRVAEMASFFGIQTWFYRKVSELSGGQKQLLNLASVMVMQPSALILDEPTGQLDPIAASEFISIIGKINRELGVTVIISEHRLEDVFPLADQVIVMDSGAIIADGAPEAVGAVLRERGHNMFRAMPAPMRIWAAVENTLPCPLTVRDGREWISRMSLEHPPKSIAPATASATAPAVELSEVWFRYEKNLPDVIKGLSFKAYAGEICTILGGNGTGKTTALSLISGVNIPYRGKVYINGAPVGKLAGHLFDQLLGVLPQNPQTLFVQKTVESDLYEMLSDMRKDSHDGNRSEKLSAEEKQKRIAQVTALCRLDGLLASHPYDLSGGEQQRAALAKVLLLQPRILLLDEPTKGLDAEFKAAFAGILKGLTDAGAAVIMVSHDVEFCAEYADRCAFIFDGNIMSEGTPRELFHSNSFYTTAVSRMARNKLPGAVTVNDVIIAFGGEPPSQGEGKSGGGADDTLADNTLADDTLADNTLADDTLAEADMAGLAVAPHMTKEESPLKAAHAAAKLSEQSPPKAAHAAAKLSAQRKIVAVLLIICLLGTVLFAVSNFKELSAFISGGDLSQFIPIEALYNFTEGGTPVSAPDSAPSSAPDSAPSSAPDSAPSGEPDSAPSDMTAGAPGSAPGDSINKNTWKYVALMLALVIESIALMFILTWKRGKSSFELRSPAAKHALSKRTIAATAMILLAIPLTVYVGVYFLGDRKYYFISMLILLEAMLPFVLVFESRKPKARELIIIAVLCAIAVAGRAAFFMLPHFKPVLAIVIIAGVAFGGETGFLVGAMTGFISNIFFAQGPWTPWQMFSFGVVGFLAGVLFRKGLLSRGRGALCTFGAVTALFIYGLIMDSSMVLMYQANPTRAMFLFTYMQGIPMNLIHTAATVFFLFIISRPMLEKLDRIKVKYGLVE